MLRPNDLKKCSTMSGGAMKWLLLVVGIRQRNWGYRKPSAQTIKLKEMAQ